MTNGKQQYKKRRTSSGSVAVDQVSAVLAHEVRNVLTSLDLFAELLENSPEHQAEWLSHLRAGIQRLSGTVENVLSLHANKSLFLEAFDVQTEAEMTARFLRPLAREARVNLSFAVRGDAEFYQCKVIANRSALHQILTNLCINAFRHTPAGGDVEIRCDATNALPRKAHISVTDTGCGISKEQLSHLFNADFVGSDVGCGLGLAVCERLARHMGGGINVKSRVGHGSTFTLELSRA